MSRLFVGNIPHASSDADLKTWVEAQGLVVDSVQIVRDRSTGMSRGFGFVVLKVNGRLQEAISLLNGQRMGGRILTVNEALPSRGGVAT
jgi:RNA recognition motif-containing protein